MAKQAMAAHTVLGFDAVRVPFSQTFEAEALGCRLKPGGPNGIPGVNDPPPYKLEDTPEFPDDFLDRGKIQELLKAVRILKKELGAALAFQTLANQEVIELLDGLLSLSISNEYVFSQDEVYEIISLREQWVQKAKKELYLKPAPEQTF